MPAQVEFAHHPDTPAMSELSTRPNLEHARWAVILAGGDGSRLRGVTRLLAGDDRPKQFCSFVGNETLLDRTRYRVAWLIPDERISVVVTKAHREFFEPNLTRAAPFLTIQPENRGTGPAILYSLFCIRRRDPGALVAIFPSSHYIVDETVFLTSVESAFKVIGRRSELIVVLGMVPDSPAADYSWIEPSSPIPHLSAEPVFHVSRFCEKPTVRAAERMFARGWLWNSTVVIGSVAALLHLFEDVVPALYYSFQPVARALGSSSEVAVLERVYRGLDVVDFRAQVLPAYPQALIVSPVGNTGWMDLGDEMRALALIARTRMRTGRASD